MARAANTALKTYRTKRDFARTPEPKGRAQPKSGKGRSFVIQKHAARRMHYDLRLEHQGVLLSWAVTKGPSFDPSDKRLAVRTEDHPLAYGDFEGVIPPGEYGAGTVMIWDRGTWEPVGDPGDGLKRGVLKFRLNGARLKGGWALVRMNRERRGRASRENWLLVKERDERARDNGMSLLEEAATSAASGRDMQAIAEGGRTWSADRTGVLPSFIAPQLATLVDAPPDGDDWLHEIKYDGYRALAHVAGGRVAIHTRNGLDWTHRFKSVARPLAALRCASAVIDGEIAVADEMGRTDFGALQNALSAGGAALAFYVFDLLWLDGQDMRGQTQVARKERLRTLLADLPEGEGVVYSDHMLGQGGRVFKRACEIGLEGIVSKRADAPYRSGRTQAWRKAKCRLNQELVIVCWQPSDKAGRPFASILLGVRENGSLRYCGKVGTGFSEAEMAELARQFRRLARKRAPVTHVPRAVARVVRWVRPVLVAEIVFNGWTREGLIRQGAYKGLRADKPADAVVREVPMPAERKSQTEDGAVEIEGVRVTNPDRVLFPGQGIAKRALIEYYLSVAERMLPYLRQRPLSLVRCPQGSEGECFYQKHASPGFPDAFKRVAIAETSGEGEYLYIDDPKGLIAAVQMGVLELHGWAARIDRLDRPDRLVFDLDPDKGVAFDAVKRAARTLRARLQDIELQSFLLATGGKGLHVVVPLLRHHDWETHKDFAQALARTMAADDPDAYTTNMSKRARAGRIFIDYLRNDRGATAIAPYSSRARSGAPVALPLSWNALARLRDGRPATVADTPARLARQKRDPWAGYFELRQALPLAALGLAR